MPQSGCRGWPCISGCSPARAAPSSWPGSARGHHRAARIGRALAVASGSASSPPSSPSDFRGSMHWESRFLPRIGRRMAWQEGNVLRVDRRLGAAASSLWHAPGFIAPRGGEVMHSSALAEPAFPSPQRPCQRSSAAMADASVRVRPRHGRGVLGRRPGAAGGHRPEGAVGCPSDRAPFLERCPRRGRGAVACGNPAGAIQVEELANLTSTDYGRILIAKTLLVMLLLALAALNRLWLTPGLATPSKASGTWLVRSVGAEIVLCVAILAAVGLWRFTPPPRALADSADAAASASVHLHTPRIMAQVTLSPGRVGNTRARIVIASGRAEPIDAKEVTLILSKPDAGIEAITRQAVRSERRRLGSRCPAPSRAGTMAGEGLDPHRRLRAGNPRGYCHGRALTQVGTCAVPPCNSGRSDLSQTRRAMACPASS